MSNWNPYGNGYDDSYPSGGSHQFGYLAGRDSGYGSASSTGKDNDWQAPNCFQQLIGGLAEAPSLAGNLALASQPAAFTESMPSECVSFDPTSYQPESAVSYTVDPANLQYGPIPLYRPGEEEDELLIEEATPPAKVETQPEQPVKRKRGRPPKLNRNGDSKSSMSDAANHVPHNQVERKYRETLNAEMERLRVSIPTLPKHNPGSLVGPPKPSKAMVLSTAISYIKNLELETDRLARENDELRCLPDDAPISRSGNGRRNQGKGAT